jgi:hypothetical protein
MMRHMPILLLGAVLAGLGGCSGSKTPVRDEADDVRASFQAYKQAILARDGATALSHVDKKTLQYYERMRDAALTANRGTVQAMSTVDKLMVLMLRARIPAAQLQQMSPEELFRHAVNQGWIGRESVEGNEVGDVEVSGDTATAVHVSRGQTSSFKWVFHKEDDAWKIDLTSMMPTADWAMKQVIQQSGMPEDQVLLQLLQATTGMPASDALWDPLVR